MVLAQADGSLLLPLCRSDAPAAHFMLTLHGSPRGPQRRLCSGEWGDDARNGRSDPAEASPRGIRSMESHVDATEGRPTAGRVHACREELTRAHQAAATTQPCSSITNLIRMSRADKSSPSGSHHSACSSITNIRLAYEFE